MTLFPIVPAVLEQHVDELTSLRSVRDGLNDAPHIDLRDLARFDERLAAHEDGCVLAGGEGLRVLTEQLDEITAGRVFGLAVVGFALNDRPILARCVALAEASPHARLGLTSALGWVEPTQLRGIVKGLLNGPSATQVSLGLAACRQHGVDPGAPLRSALTSSGDDVRSEAARTATVIGLRDAAPDLAAVVVDDPTWQFWSAWGAVLLGERTAGLDRLMNVAQSPGAYQRQAFRLACQAMNVTDAHAILRGLAGNPGLLRWLIEGSGIVGDPGYAPWLIRQMTDPPTARLAAEAFALITGVNFNESHLTGKRPDDFQSGPNDDPADNDVAVDPDDNLPWPDVSKTEAWWEANRRRFEKGQRYFIGEPVTKAHCVDVLKTGYQRQRILAAHYLCLLDPGTPLFNTAAPAWRQQRLLAGM